MCTTDNENVGLSPMILLGRYRPVSECNIWTDDDNPLTDDLPEVETGHVPLEVGGKEVAKKSSVFAATPPGV